MLRRYTGAINIFPRCAPNFLGRSLGGFGPSQGLIMSFIHLTNFDEFLTGITSTFAEGSVCPPCVCARSHSSGFARVAGRVTLSIPMAHSPP